VEAQSIQVGIMGFSAGGEIAVLASTRYDSGKPDAADPSNTKAPNPIIKS